MQQTDPEKEDQEEEEEEEEEELRPQHAAPNCCLPPRAVHLCAPDGTGSVCLSGKVVVYCQCVVCITRKLVTGSS